MGRVKNVLNDKITDKNLIGLLEAAIKKTVFRVKNDIELKRKINSTSFDKAVKHSAQNVVGYLSGDTYM